MRQCNITGSRGWDLLSEILMGTLVVFCAEAIAVKSGLLFMLAGYNDNVIVESDSLRIITMLNAANLEKVSYIFAIIDDCKLITRKVKEITFKHVSRLYNRVAYGLADLIYEF